MTEDTTVHTIVEYNEFEAKMDVVREAANFIPDTSTEEGYEKSKRVALNITKVLSKLEATRKDLKEDSLEYGRRVDGEAKPIKATLEELREPHKAAYKAVDLEKKQREEKRKADMEQRIQGLKNIPSLMADSDSGGIQACLEDLRKNDCEGFYEMTEQALLARNKSIETLENMYATELRREREAEELAELRAKQVEEERVRDAERDMERKIKEAADAKAAEQQKVIDDLMAEKAERDRQDQEKADQEERERKAEQYKLEEAEELERQKHDALTRQFEAEAERKRNAQAQHKALQQAKEETMSYLENMGMASDLADELVIDLIDNRVPNVTWAQ